jgi:hypothetical protein
MNEKMEAAVPVSPMCGTEIEELVDQAWIPRDCTNVALWRVRVSVGDGPLSDPMYRCFDHVGGTVDFSLNERSTSSILMERLPIVTPVEVRS